MVIKKMEAIWCIKDSLKSDWTGLTSFYHLIDGVSSSPLLASISSSAHNICIVTYKAFLCVFFHLILLAAPWNRFPFWNCGNELWELTCQKLHSSYMGRLRFKLRSLNSQSWCSFFCSIEKNAPFERVENWLRESVSKMGKAPIE